MTLLHVWKTLVVIGIVFTVISLGAADETPFWRWADAITLGVLAISYVVEWDES